MLPAHESRTENSDPHDNPPIEFSGQTERRQLVARSLHRAVDFLERRPRVTEEFDLYTERTGKAALLHGVEHRFEIDVSLADRRKIPDTPFTALVLQMAMDQFRQRNLQIGDGIDPTVELRVRGVIVDKDVLAVDALQNWHGRCGRLCDLAVDLDAEQNVARRGVICEFMDIADEGFFVFALAVVAADGGVHDFDAHALTEIDGLETILQPVLGR